MNDRRNQEEKDGGIKTQACVDHAHCSEPRSNAESEKLFLVGAFFQEWIGQVDGEGPEGRVPGYAGADRCPEARLVRESFPSWWSFHKLLKIAVEQGAEVGEGPAPNTILFRQSQRKGQLQRARGVFVATEEVSRVEVARSDTPRSESAQVGAAEEERVRDADVLVKAEDIPGFTRDARNQVLADRTVVPDVQPRSQIPGVASRPGSVVRHADEIAVGGIELAIAPVVRDLLADDRRQLRSLLHLDGVGGGRFDIEDLVIAQIVANVLTQELAPIPAKPKAAPQISLFERPLARPV